MWLPVESESSYCLLAVETGGREKRSYGGRESSLDCLLVGASLGGTRYIVKKLMSFALSGQRPIEISQSGGGGSLADSKEGQRTAVRTWWLGG